MCSDTKHRTLHEAGRLFAQAGYSATSMGDIADAVGIKKATLYHHFKSKNEILEEVLKHVSTEVKDALKQSIEGISQPEEQIRALATALVSFFRNFPEMHIFSMIAVSQEDTREVAQYVMNLKKDMFTFLRDLIIEINPNRDGDNKSATLISFTLLGMVINAHLRVETETIEELIDHLVSIIKRVKN